MVDVLRSMSWHGAWYSIDEKITGPRPIAMWLYGLFVKTCFLSSGTTPGGGCTANAMQRQRIVTSCQTILIKVVLRPIPRDSKLRIRHFHICI